MCHRCRLSRDPRMTQSEHRPPLSACSFSRRRRRARTSPPLGHQAVRGGCGDRRRAQTGCCDRS
jgi:hypothetical protein